MNVFYCTGLPNYTDLPYYTVLVINLGVGNIFLQIYKLPIIHLVILLCLDPYVSFSKIITFPPRLYITSPTNGISHSCNKQC